MDEEIFGLFLMAIDQLGGDDDTAEDERDDHILAIKGFFEKSHDDKKVAVKIVNYALEFMGGYLEDMDSKGHQNQVLSIVKNDMVDDVSNVRRKMATV